MGGRPTSIVTERLVLEPVTRPVAEAVLTGRLSGIAAGAGWPHADTADAMAMALGPDPGPSWLVTLDEVVIGDCGAFSWPDEDGVVEVGYGIAAPYRGNGYATEAATAMCDWLRREAGARAITATAVEADNLPSRRILEKLGFVVVDGDGRQVSYRLE